MAIIGIDLGTTNSLVAIWKNGESVLIPNEFGEYLTPSVVGIDDQDEVIVGKIAKERLVSHPDKTAAVFKRNMGSSTKYKLGKRIYAPEELSAFVLLSLKKDAENFLGEEIEEAIISVPAYFDDAKRQATKKAGIIAGLKVERIINEPSAAALACRMQERQNYVANTLLSLFHEEDVEEEIDEKIYMVFDFGGGTLDISLVECFENVVSITAVSGNNQLGGSDIDTAIAKQFCHEQEVDLSSLDPHIKAVVMKQAEACKIEMTTQKTAQMVVKTEGLEGEMEVTQEKLIKICAEVFHKILKPISNVLMDAQTSVSELDEIVLIGGSSKMPVISRFLEAKLGKKPITIGSPDTMVALGLGIYAGMKERNEEIKDMVMTDICPFTLGIGVHNEEDKTKLVMSPIIERNTVLPCSKTEVYCPLTQTQKEITFKFYQGENYYVKDNISLGELTIPLPSNRDNNYLIELRMTYDINGILIVDITDMGRRLVYEDRIIKNPEMSFNDMEKLKQRLEQVKKDSKENAEEKLLMERGEGLYYMTSGSVREDISKMMNSYKVLSKNATPLKLKKYRKRLSDFFDQVESFLSSFGISTPEFDTGDNWDELLDDTED